MHIEAHAPLLFLPELAEERWLRLEAELGPINSAASVG
jgi:hypothetical protein